MSGKVDFLNFFFDSKSYSEVTGGTGRFMDSLPAILFIYDSCEQKITYRNAKFRKELPEWPAGRSLRLEALVAEEDIPTFRKALDSMRQSPGDTVSVQCRLRDNAMANRYFRVTMTVLRRIDDDNASILFLLNDITRDVQRAEADALLEQAEEMLDAGSWRVDSSSGRFFCTRGFLRLLGYESRRISGEQMSDFLTRHVADEQAELFRSTLLHAASTREPFELEHIVRCANGVLKTLLTKGKVIVTGDNVTIAGTSRDITSSKVLEKQREENLQELDRSNRELEGFAYVASHDLNEPLRKISMFAERLNSRYHSVLDSEGRHFMNRILSTAESMRHLIDNLLEFSRASRAKSPFAAVNLNDVITRVLTQFDLWIEETKAEIAVHDLPVIEAVSSEMEQLFSNLISNSLKFRRAGDPPRITISSAPKADVSWPDGTRRSFYVIEVRDNGIGFEGKYAGRIFEVFQRLHSKAEYPGSGVGLAICKKIVENHNGIITAQGEPGAGAMFRILIPEKQF